MRISIDLRKEEIEAIRQQAERERRSPREQAAWLLSKAIAQSGNLKTADRREGDANG